MPISRHRFLLLLNGKCKIPPSPTPYVLGLYSGSPHALHWVTHMTDIAKVTDIPNVGGIYLLILGSLVCNCDEPLEAQQICARYACYGCKRIPLFLFALKE